VWIWKATAALFGREGGATRGGVGEILRENGWDWGEEGEIGDGEVGGKRTESTEGDFVPQTE